MESVFDAEEFRAALAPPEIKLGRRLYRGRVLSIEEWMPFQKVTMKVIARTDPAVGLDMTSVRDLVLRYCDLVFPRPWWERLLPRKSVGEQVLALPPTVMLEALRYFFRSQGLGMKISVAVTPVVEDSPEPPAAT